MTNCQPLRPNEAWQEAFWALAEGRRTTRLSDEEALFGLLHFLLRMTIEEAADWMGLPTRTAREVEIKVRRLIRGELRRKGLDWDYR